MLERKPLSMETAEKILAAANVTKCQPIVIEQIMALMVRESTDILSSAMIFSAHANREVVMPADVRLAVESRNNRTNCQKPPRKFISELARKVNSQPLPEITGKKSLRLPPREEVMSGSEYMISGRSFKRSDSIL